MLDDRFPPTRLVASCLLVAAILRSLPPLLLKKVVDVIVALLSVPSRGGGTSTAERTGEIGMELDKRVDEGTVDEDDMAESHTTPRPRRREHGSLPSDRQPR